MSIKSAEEMERSELIGMVKALQRQVEELTDPERTRLYQVGRLADMARKTESGIVPERTSLWEQLLPRRAAGG